MRTECSAKPSEFARVDGRPVVADFDGGALTSDAGGLLLGAADRVIDLVGRLAGCFRDARDPRYVEHSVSTLIGQRVYGIALGYEDREAVGRLFLEAHARAPKQIILDLDATDDPLHGEQEGRFFHGYYDCYCYLPLYVFCGRHLLAAKLRPSNIDASAGATEEIARIVEQIRARWPRVRILLRADSGFARESLMVWCETHRVDFVFGLARNPRLVDEIYVELANAEEEASRTGRPARRFKDFVYQTIDSWSRRRRVVAKAEWTGGEANPRFVVTSLRRQETPARTLYEDVYCARGEMENRIKECQADLFADRTSAATMRANQLRLWFASFAYVLLCAVRRIGLAHTQFAEATCGTIRLKLMKLAGLVRVSARRIKFSLASACPYADEWRLAAARLARDRRA
jgi:hypothetical protein